MHKQTLQGIYEGKLAGVDAARQEDKEGELETTFTSRCHQLGIESLGVHQATDFNLLILVCCISNALDGFQDDFVSVEMDTEEERAVVRKMNLMLMS